MTTTNAAPDTAFNWTANPGKTFIPLENNPSVLTHLLHTWGVRPTLTFHDIYSLDPSSGLLSFIPRPVHALILIVPAHIYHPCRDNENDQLPLYTGSGADEPIFWARQTIGHACGTMAALHAVANGPARKHIIPDSALAKLLKGAEPLGPEPRAQLLYDSEDLEAAHASAAGLGDSRAPAKEEPNSNHFIAFVVGDDRGLWELNGGMKGPVRRGTLEEGEDALSERALDLGVRGFLEEAKRVGEGEIGFSIVALAEGGESDGRYEEWVMGLAWVGVGMVYFTSDDLTLGVKDRYGEH
ncbi:MAG: ubiquitinyl hydrolase 1 [Bogoriella megaspora]|nr:MAG: ubiquitinyl hydrolase 1 [Bogoriella megaspora]